MLLLLILILVVAALIGAGYAVAGKLNKEAFANPVKLRKELAEFKQNAEKVTVPLRDCKVVSNSHTETVLKSENWRVQALDSLYGNGSSNLRTVNVNQSQLVYRITEGQTHYDYVSPVVFMEKATLLFKLDFQNETTLYIDKNDRSKYYFDLEFLIPKNN